MNKPSVTLVIRRSTDSIGVVLDVARLRARDLRLALDVVRLDETAAPSTEVSGEGITAIVPVEFAARHHEAWCFLCQLSLLCRDVPVSILVLGAESSDAFQARQRALLSGGRPSAAPAVRQPRRRRARAA